VSAEEWRDYQSLVTKLAEKGAARLSPVCSGESVATIGGYEFYILNPAARVNGVDSGTLHDNCLVVMAVREKEKLIFCGDASDRALKRVGDTFDLSNTHILHASSHGALPGAHAGFIRQTNPRYTIISTRSGIREQVPSAEAMKRYLAYTRGKVFQTDIHGTVRFS
jgi:beta-lactamase superfamily II metal-dependent hydrolase